MKFLVAVKNGEFFRAQTTRIEDVEKNKLAMLENQEGLEFEVMSNEEYEEYIDNTSDV